MVSQRNVLTVKDVSEQLRQYPVIGILDMFKLPASQLHQIRNMLRGKAVIRMVKKRLIILALKDSGIRGVEVLEERLQGEPALIMTEMNPFRLAHLIDKSKSEAPAKRGDVAPRDIGVRAGPTTLPPGPVIGELQKAKIPCMIEGDKIHIREDTVIAREGQVIDSLLAGVMSKLGITPMEIGLNILTVWEKGEVYDRDILFIPQEAYISDLVAAHQGAFNLALNTGYLTSETMPLFLARAHQEALSLALAADIPTSETVRLLLAKAHTQAEALKAAARPAEEPQPEAKPGEAKEKKPEEQEKPDAQPEPNKEEKATEETKPEAKEEEKPKTEEESKESKKEEKGE